MCSPVPHVLDHVIMSWLHHVIALSALACAMLTSCVSQSEFACSCACLVSVWSSETYIQVSYIQVFGLLRLRDMHAAPLACVAWDMHGA
jgi:hypothetical protein